MNYQRQQLPLVKICVNGNVTAGVFLASQYARGYRISGNTVKRITAIQRINKSRKLKRYWKSKGRAKLGRTLLKRKMSNIRRKSMGIR